MFDRSSSEVIKKTLSIAWPAVAESVFLTLAGMIDTIMVSQLGSYAISAIGLTNQPKFLGWTLFFCLNTAVAAFVARRKGEENRRGANEIFLTSTLYALFLTIIITIVFIVFADDMMRLVGSNEDTHAPAVTYFRIVMGGTFFNVFSMLMNAAFRGAGDTNIAMISNIGATLVNIFCNFLLIEGNWGFPALGVTGAAIATVIGMAVSMLICLIYLCRESSFVSLRYMLQNRIKATWEQAKSVIKFQASMLIEFVGFRVGFMVTAVMAAGLGTDEFAIHQVGMNLLSLGFACGDGMRVAAVTLTGQKLGAKKPEEARHYTQVTQRIGLVMAAMIAVIMLFFGDSLFNLFFQGDKPAILPQMGRMISYLIMIVSAFQISQIIYSGSLQAAGDLKYTNLVSLISVGIIRSLITYVTVSVMQLGLKGIWLGVLADQVSRYIALSYRFRQFDFHCARRL